MPPSHRTSRHECTRRIFCHTCVDHLHHHILQAFYDATWRASFTYMKEGGSADNLRDYGNFPIQNYSAFHSIVQSHYSLETIIDGIVLYRRKAIDD